MPHTYEDINYKLRPAKHIERKMICEALRNLEPFGNVDTYRYIGFGSVPFADFILFHRALNISDMISIERDEDRSDRFVFNKPFRCIELIFGSSNDVLPTLTWLSPTILWLDYDYELKSESLTDVEFFCASAGVGSVIIVTMNSHPGSGARLEKLKENVGEGSVPTSVTSDSDLNGWKTAKVYRDIVTNRIEATLSERNGGLSAEKQLIFKQLFHFNYRDGAQMLTIGGVLFDEEHRAVLEKCEFDEIEYISSTDTPLQIMAPPLTHKELQYLDTHLPRAQGVSFASHGIPDEVINFYSSFYRYFPKYADVDT